MTKGKEELRKAQTHALSLEKKIKTLEADLETQMEEARQFKEQALANKKKLSQLEANLPTMLREMVNFYFDLRVENRLENFVTADVLQEKLKVKMDYAHFCQHLKK